MLNKGGELHGENIDAHLACKQMNKNIIEISPGK